MDDDWFPRHPVLRPGLRVVRRDDGHQVGRWPGERVLLPRDPAVSAFLDDLVDGRRPALDAPGPRRWATQLLERGLLVDDEARGRAAARGSARVSVAGNGPWAEAAAGLLEEAGLVLAGRGTADVVLVVSPTGDLVRDDLDPWVREAVPHLPVTHVAGRVTVGPFVAPGLTACVRCVDAHGSDLDPGHGLVLEQHAPDDGEPVDPTLVRLALAWAVRDVVRYVEGDVPATWSATVRVDASLRPERTAWSRHPRCGCSWGEDLATG